MGFLIRVLINGVAIWFATLVLPGLEVVGGETDLQHIGIILAVALVFGIVNAVVKPIVALISIPLYILTLGLFTIVVNALMLMLTSWITESTSWGLRIDNFGTACWGAIIISVVSFVLSMLTSNDRTDSRSREITY
ncbi:phage holin family protein [Cellulomonas fengjieae]|uniref:Phage holin family protein n=1 Tax=Cellulomonas fengjieae TaxID=2819978 RepID=A0ABS3SK63_9CELL|nr:phage holin family protein [Cellulomonas fengjieae]MBO3086133.1 phage holin family protein [Cellulomonas fengjieae]MBO3102463.1 phage holin family protein [Cellulomonas fengjieae]QVI65805.1 phage holin family protein [Cellulomonas fengjieae]